MSTVNFTNSLIEQVPREIVSLISMELSLKGVGVAIRVCKSWKKTFDSDFIWMEIGKKFGIKTVSNQSIYCLGFVSFINYFPGVIRRCFLDDYKTKVRKFFQQKNLQEILEIESNYNKILLQIFGSAREISRLPAKQMTINDLLEGTIIEPKHFVAPITRIRINFFLNRDYWYGLLLRIKNNITNKIHYDSTSLMNYGGRLCFDVSYTIPRDRVICPQYLLVTQIKLDRLTRLILGQPVGLLLAQGGILEKEGPRLTPDGKSVLELV